jgi:hypothetical protein
MVTIIETTSRTKQVIFTPTEDDITEMISAIKSNRLSITDIPVIHHPLIFARLQIAKNEAEFSRQQDLYDHLSDALWSLQLTKNMPEKEVYRDAAVSLRPGQSLRLSQTAYPHTTSLVSSYRSTADSGSLLRRLESDVRVSERFWRLEERRLSEIESAALERLERQHRQLPLPPDPVQRAALVNEREAEVLALQRGWLAKMAALEERRNHEIDEIRRKIKREKGGGETLVMVPRIPFSGRQTRKWRLFGGYVSEKEQERMIAVAEPADPGPTPETMDCLIRTGIALSGGHAPRRKGRPAIQ